MATVRRWYLLLVSLISLQSITWAIIALLRGLLASRVPTPLEEVAFQLAVVVVGLPIFLVHWLWWQRLAAREAEEGASTLRHLYLRLTLVLFLLPAANNVYHLVASILRPLLGEAESAVIPLGERLASNAVALVVLGLFWLYHRRLVAAAPTTSDEASALRRAYLLLLSAAGLALTVAGAGALLYWLMRQIGPPAAGGSVAEPLALLAVGLPLWLAFWRAAQQLFTHGTPAEREALLYKLYLYAVVFVTALGTVGALTVILAGILRRLLSLPPEGDIREPLSLVLTLAVPWVYHSIVLRAHARLATEGPRQATIRRLYLYLMAAIGLAAFLVGIAGNLSVLISLLDRAAITEPRESLAWFTAALLAGLPLWLLPWRQVQHRATLPDAAGHAERRSLVRRLYLYFFIFAATMTVLIGAIYVVSQLLMLALGEREVAGLLSDIGQALAFVLIAVGVWLYHGFVMRGDGQRGAAAQQAQLAAMRVAVVDLGAGRFGEALRARLRAEMPGLTILPVGPIPPAEEGASLLPEADILVVPWEAAAPGLTAADPALAAAIAASPARRLLVPTPAAGWEWAGLPHATPDERVGQTVQALQQMIAGEAVGGERRPSGAIIALAILGILALLCALGPLFGLILSLSEGGF